MRSRSIRYQSMRQKLEIGMTIRRALRDQDKSTADDADSADKSAGKGSRKDAKGAKVKRPRRRASGRAERAEGRPQ